MQLSCAEEDMENVNNNVADTAMEAAMKAAINKKSTAKGPVDKDITTTLPDTSDIVVVSVKQEVSGPTYEERKKWAEDLGRKEAENKAMKIVLERKCNGEIGLLPGQEQAAYRGIETALNRISSAIAVVDDGLKGHVAVAALIRKVELITENVKETGVIEDADKVLRDMVSTKRFRLVTVSEKEALTSKKGTAPSHVVIGHNVIIVPLELTAANKTLADRLMALVRTEKSISKAKEVEGVAAMKSRATITLTEVLNGKVPSGGRKPIVYLAASKKMILGIDRSTGAQIEKWIPGFQILLEVKDSKSLHILQAAGSAKVSQSYKDMMKNGRSIPLTFVSSGKITKKIQDEDLYRDTRRLLEDVLRGLENETEEAQKAAEVSSGGMITAEPTEAFEASDAPTATEEVSIGIGAAAE